MMFEKKIMLLEGTLNKNESENKNFSMFIILQVKRGSWNHWYKWEIDVVVEGGVLYSLEEPLLHFFLNIFY